MEAHKKIVKMTRMQYEDHIHSSKRELKRLKEEVKRLRAELDKSVSDYHIAKGYESTLRAMF